MAIVSGDRPAGQVITLDAVSAEHGLSRSVAREAVRVPEAMIKRTRDYDDTQWEHHQAALQHRGLLDTTGELTNSGRQLKQRIEDATDALAQNVFDSLKDSEVETLFQTLTPITRTVIAGGHLPEATPMGLSRDNLDDGGAHLR